MPISTRLPSQCSGPLSSHMEHDPSSPLYSHTFVPQLCCKAVHCPIRTAKIRALNTPPIYLTKIKSDRLSSHILGFQMPPRTKVNLSRAEVLNLVKVLNL